MWVSRLVLVDWKKSTLALVLALATPMEAENLVATERPISSASCALETIELNLKASPLAPPLPSVTAGSNWTHWRRTNSREMLL